jgi:hypothetical protein
MRAQNRSVHSSEPVCTAQEKACVARVDKVLALETAKQTGETVSCGVRQIRAQVSGSSTMWICTQPKCSPATSSNNFELH